MIKYTSTLPPMYGFQENMQLMDLIGLDFGMTQFTSSHTKYLSIPYNPHYLLNTLQPLYPV